MYRYPMIGERVVLIEVGKDGEEIEYFTKVADIKGEVITLEMPIKKSLYVMFFKNTKLKLRYKSEYGGMNELTCIVTGKKKGVVPLLIVKKNSPITKMQRRRFYRLKISLKVSISKKDDIIVENTETIDLSAGGMRFKSKYELKAGTIVTCEFKIFDDLVITNSEVVRIEKTEDSYFYVSVEFLDLSDEKREAIVKFNLQKQREAIVKTNLNKKI